MLSLYKEEKNQNIRKIIRKRKKRGVVEMSDIFCRYIGKDCIVYTSNSNSSAIECNITAVENNWLYIKTKDGDEVINFDYIVRIKEHPLNKKGKKKSVIF